MASKLNVLNEGCATPWGMLRARARAASSRSSFQPDVNGLDGSSAPRCRSAFASTAEASSPITPLRADTQDLKTSASPHEEASSHAFKHSSVDGAEAKDGEYIMATTNWSTAALASNLTSPLF